MNYEVDSSTPFNYLLKTPEGRNLILQGGLMGLLFIFIVPIFILSGYAVTCARELAMGRPAPPVFSWGHAGNGAKLMAVGFVAAAPVFVFWILLVVSAAQTGSLGGVGSYFAAPMMVGGFMLVGVYSLALAVLQPAFVAILATSGRISDCFRPRILAGMIKPWGWNYAIIFLLGYVSGLIASLGFLLCFIGIFFTWFYSVTVQAHLASQLARPFLRPDTSPSGAAT